MLKYKYLDDVLSYSNTVLILCLRKWNKNAPKDYDFTAKTAHDGGKYTKRNVAMDRGRRYTGRR